MTEILAAVTTEKTLSSQKLIEIGRTVINAEQQALTELLANLDQSFAKACQLLLTATGKIILIGMGKSGHIAKKIAATLSSTGSPAFFIHAGEANHGDIGALSANDLVIALSYSGNTSEIVSLIPNIKRLGINLIAITGDNNSKLAKFADIHLTVNINQEACPLGLAPTASSTATLALGDALAMALTKAKNFSADDFARSHPGGSLGRKLLLTVKDIMLTDEHLPIVSPHLPISAALLEMTSKGLGMTAVVDDNMQILGIFTDGDLRRTIRDNRQLTTLIAQVMTKNCTTISADLLASEAVNLMEQKQINGLLVVNNSQKLIGMLTMHTLLRNKII